MPKYSVLIIGCGSIGERHLRCFQQSGRADVTACDVNPVLLKKMADTYGAPGEPDWEKAVASGRYQVVVVCAPAQFHIAMGIKSLQSGCHTLLEKPLSNSLKGVDELIAAREQSGKKIAVAYTSWVMPFLCQARDFIKGGGIGPVRQVAMIAGQAFHLLRPAYRNTYYKDRFSGGGAIQDALTHQTNWVESVIGPAESVMADCAHLELDGVSVEDTAHVTSRHPGGALASFAINQFQMPNEITLQLNAAKGSVKIEYHAQRWGVLREGEADWTWTVAAVPARDSHFIAEANAFLDQIEGKPPRLCSVEEAAHSLRFNLAALASAASGARVYTKDIHA